MRDYDLKKWSRATGETRLRAEPKQRVSIRAASSKPLRISRLDGDRKIPIRSGCEVELVCSTEDCEVFAIDGTGKTVYGYSFETVQLQEAEPINHDDPPAVPAPGNSNLILQMRQLFQEQMAATRLPVLEPEDSPFAGRYELDEADDLLFEEEIAEQARQARDDDRSQAHDNQQPSQGKRQSQAENPSVSEEQPELPVGEPSLPGETGGQEAAE